MKPSTLVFYEAPHSSSSPVACMLAELGVAHERVRLDLAAGEQKQASFLALNPNGKVPTIVADGTPAFEALAIMLWLADTYGPEKGLWPAMDDPRRLEALSWSTWAYVSFGSAVVRYLRLGHEGLPRDAKEIELLLGILDARLAAKAYALGEAFSLADIVLGGAVGFAASIGLPVAQYAHVVGWMERCRSRPSFRTSFG